MASAYYKGDEKNPQLQRIYGTAFKTKKDLDEYFTMLEEAKKRDHRKLGKELQLFVLEPFDVGKGLPMWLPRGAAIIEELEKLAKETEFAAGYERVRTPHIAHESLYKKSGHLPYYADSMFPYMQMKPEEEEARRLSQTEKKVAEVENALRELESVAEVARKNAAFREQIVGVLTSIESAFETLRKHFIERQDVIERVGGVRDAITNLVKKVADSMPDVTQVPVLQAENQSKIIEWKRVISELHEQREEVLAANRIYLKSMNCPHHHKLFAAIPRSYRDLPLRLAEYGTCYRYEQSGELFGLMRVRSMQMNDAHIYCTPEQFETEFNAVNEMYLKYFKLFGIDKYLMRFSTHDPAKLGQKFVDEPELWKQTEVMTRRVLKDSGINYVEVPNEAAFYGPKIDVQAWSVIGREFSIATNQVDFAQPRNFNLRYKDKDNTEKIPICIHRAPLGTHERFIGFLIEHYAGNFPLWLSPEQVRILTISDDPKLMDFARSILKELRAHQVRAEIDESSDKINGKIQRAEQMKVHTMFVIGKRDLEADAVSVRVHGKGNLGPKPRAEAIAEILSSIKERRAD